MSFLKALIIHPDREVSATLREYLAKEEQIKILGEAMTSFEALELLENIAYDVFFLGIDLPNGVDGIELAQILNQRKQRPALVFIASDEHMAFKAFEVGATDYLLWPFPKARLQKTIERLLRVSPQLRIIERSKLKKSEDDETVHIALGEEEEDLIIKALRQAWDYKQYKQVEIEKLPINQDGKLLLIPYNQIVFVEAFEDYSYVHTANDKYLTSYRLKNLEERLRQYRFFRVHRKYLVNLDMVTEIASLPGSNFMLRTAGKKRIELPISRRRIGELKQILGL
ncbi:LytR/AlgR family response regulator transcription factor [Desulfovulcanus ferrireducens]|uniref:LytR/AlgR family response regulator transcription factor n=1 Tax=Desulfovulcanus ferrireducens TaxID=2831190 RepID=UPI00207BCC20|nr:LytTR family DNA-binding domain-containing protein [Desulfovulcanus ferrireducens]